MFRSARLKLTAWYLLSIMTISIVFSLLAYQGLRYEIRRDMHIQALRAMSGPRWFRDGNSDLSQFEFTPGFPFGRRFPAPPLAFDTELFEEAQRRLAMNLVTINIGIFIISGVAGYFLAGRALRPIEVMVDEQKRFVADASHELRTPLTAMRTEIEVTLRDKDPTAASMKQVLESNLEEIDKLQLLSDHLLTLGRLQNTASNGKFMEVNLTDVVEEALQNVRPLALEKNIKIHSNIENIALEADRDSLVKLFVIFMDNAIKYSYENGEVFITAKSVKNKAIISVKDLGAGIRASDLPYIFNRFYRADASRSKAVPGYGLGLSIAKSIIEMHNGKVDVKSSPEQGTTFTITLPLKH
ncbi:MAG: ATP-binding protein [Actinomycetota bacterium]